MKRLLIASMLLLMPPFIMASGGSPNLQDVDIDFEDKESLQRGAKYFVDYCMGCHSMKYMRYNRMGKDVGLDEVQLRRDFIFDKETKPGDLMISAMTPQNGAKWFGTAVPDLTLVTRWRSPDWVFTYLKSFYLDESRPYGVNNTVFPDVGMPHVLASLQGVQRVSHSEDKHRTNTLELVQPGNLSKEAYDQVVRDLTNFLTYTGEPMKSERQRLGIYVLLFLGVFFVLAYALKKEYWKDIH